MGHFPYKLIDLTHPLSSAIPTWDGSCGFEHHIDHDYDPDAEYKFRTHKITTNEGIGTHMDAPAHCFDGGATIDELQLANLIVPCVIIDVSTVSHEGYSVSVQVLKDFEKEYGSIPNNSFVMMKTGWEFFWPEPEQYRNNHLFPSIAEEAAEFLLERDIAGLGIDTLSPDRPEDGFPVHKLVLGAGKYIVENAANLDSMPKRNSFILVLPIKIKAGTEAPIRLIGLTQNES